MVTALLCLIIGVAIAAMLWALLDWRREVRARKVEPPTFYESHGRVAAGGIAGALDTEDT